MCVEEVGMVDPLGVIVAPTPPPKPIDASPSKKRFPDRVIVSTYVPPLERVHPSTDMEAPGLKDVLKIPATRIPSIKRNPRLHACTTCIRITFGCL